MEDFQMKAAKYAAEKTNEAITQAIAQAYIDGYRDGYRDKESETPVNVDNSDDKYVDLGLPSGTLWARDYEYYTGSSYDICYMTYAEAQSKWYKLPTEKQVQELFNCCKYEYIRPSAKDLSDWINFIGPNGNELCFRITGRESASFWVKFDCEYKNVHNAVYMYRINDRYVGNKKLKELPEGNLAVRVVK